jgi:hypothetical protein
MKLWLKTLQREGNDKKSAVFDRKQAFSDKKTPFRDSLGGVRLQPLLSSAVSPTPHLETTMIRRRLLSATAIIAAVVLAACSDMTAPKNTCPMTSGSSTCTQ